MTKQEFVKNLEQRGSFNEELLIWDVPYVGKKEIINFAWENALGYVFSNGTLDSQFLRVTCDDGGKVYIRFVKKYRRQGDYTVVAEDGKNSYVKRVSTWKELRSVVSSVSKRSKTISIIDDNGIRVAKSLWKG